MGSTDTAPILKPQYNPEVRSQIGVDLAVGMCKFACSNSKKCGWLVSMKLFGEKLQAVVIKVQFGKSYQPRTGEVVPPGATPSITIGTGQS